MTSKAITLEAINNTTKLVTLCKKKIDLLGELRVSLIYRAIQDNVVELEVESRKFGTSRLPVGARLLWPLRTNSVGETVQDELLLDLDTFMRVAPKRELSYTTSYQGNRVRKEWNNCYGKTMEETK